MQLLSARRVATTFSYSVHLDEARLTSEGAPDPGWILSCCWSDRPRGAGESLAAFAARLTSYEAMARREMRLLCEDRLAALSPPAAGQALPGEGMAL